MNSVQFDDDYSGHLARGESLLDGYDVPFFGNVHVNLLPKQIVDATTEYTRALAIKPDSVDAMDGLGSCYATMAGYFSGAEHMAFAEVAGFYFKKTITYKKDIPSQLFRLGCVYDAEYFSGDFKGAEQTARRAISLDSGAKESYFKGDRLIKPSTDAFDHGS